MNNIVPQQKRFSRNTIATVFTLPVAGRGLIKEKWEDERVLGGCFRPISGNVSELMAAA